MKPRKWSAKEMASHGFEVGYYGGYFVDLKVPKNLSRDDHYAYTTQKLKFINALGRTMKKRAKS